MPKFYEVYEITAEVICNGFVVVSFYLSGFDVVERDGVLVFEGWNNTHLEIPAQAKWEDIGDSDEAVWEVSIGNDCKVRISHDR